MVSKKPKGLGLGLEALLGPKVSEGPATGEREGEPRRLRLDQIAPGRYQPRTRMDEGALAELAESIRVQGVMQPILVRRLGGATPVGPSIGGGPATPGFEIIAGERRARAARLAGLDEVPVLVRDVPDEAAAAMSLIENIQREDLNPLEEAQGLQRLVGEFGLTHEQAAQAVGRSRSAASNLLRLLQLAEPVQHLLMAGDLDMGHARALLSLPKAEQIVTAGEAVAGRWTVRDIERRVKRRLDEAAGTAPASRGRGAAAGKSRDVLRLEERLADVLAAPVEIRVGRAGRRGTAGEVVVRFASLEELDGLLERLGAGQEIDPR
ncbi:MAG: ParB/RepB/Spo0J family partition protein [Ideonella sp.]|nr:ParB/RepB/Spo0J family partition protein [Ideonella sp.]